MTEEQRDPPELEASLDELFGRSLDEFTAARNELARELRKGGDRAASERVKGLRKPSITAWAVNQVVLNRPDVFDALLDATEAIRDAHARGPSGLKTALEARREALAAAVQVGEMMLVGAGTVPGPGHTRRMTRSLEALSVGTGEPGRLSEDLEPPGFGGLAGLAIAAVPRPRRERRGPRAGRTRAPAAAPAGGKGSAVRTARRKGPGGEKQDAKTEASSAGRRKALASARRRRSEADAALKEAVRARKAAEKEEAGAATAIRKAERAAEAARRKAAQAEKAVEEARGLLDHTRGRLEKLRNAESEAEAELEAARQEVEGLA